MSTSDDAEVREVPSPSQPLAVARQFIEECMTDAGFCLVRSHRGAFYAWSETCWPEVEERGLRSQLYGWLEHAVWERLTPHGPELVPWAPTKAKIANVVDALHAATYLAGAVCPPAWLVETELDVYPTLVPLANGLLNVGTRELLPHTPAFFSQHSLPFAYDPDAPAPERWESFLHELWDDDQDAIDTLAEATGYIVSAQTDQQKVLMLVGPKRSGKGTIGRVMTGLLGAHNVAAPTLSSMTTNFGIAPLIGKPLAIISDARLSSRADSMVAVERLLSISGEDTLTVDRKYRDPWTGRLPTRFMILTNELPRFADASGALPSRFILLILTKSFYGREDPRLTDDLLHEAPGIFNWALAGLDRLLERGYFLQPQSGQEALQHFEDLGSPVGAFVRDSCELHPGYETNTDELFAHWKLWCADEGRPHPGTKAVFVRNLRAAAPLVQPARRRDGDKRRRVLKGIAVRGQQSNGPRPSPAQDGASPDGPGWAEDRPTVDPRAESTIDPAEIERLATLLHDTQLQAHLHPEAHVPHHDRDNSDGHDEDDAELDFDALRRQT